MRDSLVAPGACSARSRKASSRRWRQGDTFLFGGLILRFEGIHENEVIATRTADDTPKIPIYAGGKFPITSFLADGVRSLLADDTRWQKLPDQVADWLRIQKERSVIPKRGELLVETFPRGARYYMVCYPFEGRLAHQTLGMLLTRRLERARLRPVAFVATDYSLAIWGPWRSGARLQKWPPGAPPTCSTRTCSAMISRTGMADSYLLKRMFRNTALISGLIEKTPSRQGEDRPPGDHLDRPDLRRAPQARARSHSHAVRHGRMPPPACSKIARVGEIAGPVSADILCISRSIAFLLLRSPAMLQIGRESVAGDADEHVLREAAEDLINEAMGKNG